MPTFTITDLSERPQHADAVAMQIWKAFWEPYGAPYTQVRNGLEPFLKAEKSIPFAMVAEIDGRCVERSGHRERRGNTAGTHAVDRSSLGR